MADATPAGRMIAARDGCAAQEAESAPHPRGGVLPDDAALEPSSSRR